jgi:type IV secretory pathway TrbF-like protein
MDEPTGHGSLTTESPAAPRRYFDGDEGRYQRAQQRATLGENTVLRDLSYWELAGVLMLILILGLAGAVVYLALRSPLVLKFVVRDEAGQFQVLGWNQYDPLEGELTRDLENWLWCARAITTDREVHRLCWVRVALFIQERSQCATAIQQYVHQRKPDQELYRKSVVVDELRCGREPDGRWRCTWVEKTHQLDHGHTGPLLDTSRWHAIILATRREPKHPKQIEFEGRRVNPLGLLCTHLAWWK